MAHLALGLLVIFQSSKQYWWATAVSPLPYPLLRVARGIIWHFKAHHNSGYVQLFPSSERNTDVLGWKQNPTSGNEFWGALQNWESSHKHTLEIISLLQADELIQAVTTLFPSGVGCHCFPGPPDARLLLQNLSPLAAQWKEMFYALAFSRIPPVLFSAKGLQAFWASWFVLISKGVL